MKHFTFKDFIKYNSPCMICGNRPQFTLTCLTRNQGNWANDPMPLFLRTIENKIVFRLKIKYNGNLLLIIDPKTNKFELQSNAQNNANCSFDNFINENNLYAVSACQGNSCCVIESQFLEFENDFIKPLQIFYEAATISDKNTIYKLESDYSAESTLMSITKKSDFKTTRQAGISLSAPSLELKVPLIPLRSAKTKEKLISKLETYILFS